MLVPDTTTTLHLPTDALHRLEVAKKAEFYALVAEDTGPAYWRGLAQARRSLAALYREAARALSPSPSMGLFAAMYTTAVYLEDKASRHEESAARLQAAMGGESA